MLKQMIELLDEDDSKSTLVEVINMNLEPRPFVYSWVPTEDQIYFRTAKGIISVPLSSMFTYEDKNIDIFDMSPKRCYNKDERREHFVHYLNYFVNYFDPDKELLRIYSFIKYCIDYEENYTKDDFLYDIKTYILSGTMYNKISNMTSYNYVIDLSYNSKIDESLVYTNTHGMIFMMLSIMTNIVIPLLSHFMSVNRITNVDGFTLEVYDVLISRFYSMDIINKLYETSNSTNDKSQKQHSVLWNKQDIRSKNLTTHSMDSLYNILLNIIPKYVFESNIISFNYNSLLKANSYKIESITYEYVFHSLSASKRDEDNQSELDRYESYQIKKDESVYIYGKVNAEKTMQTIDLLYGPFDEKEIQYYKEVLGGNIPKFQTMLIFNMFYKFFNDTTSIKNINSDDKFKLMIAAKRILLGMNLKIMPYIISGKIEKLVNRKSINKGDLERLYDTPIFKQIQHKYQNDKIEEFVINIIGTIMSSKFTFIDYYDDEIDGMIIDIIPQILYKEILEFIYYI